MKTKNKILYILACVIIIIGVVIWKNNGFNMELQYSTRNQINLVNNTGINKTDVEQIASEVLSNTRFFVQDVEIFGNVVSIVADEITEEQKTQIIEKYNEKNGTKIDKDDTEIVTIPFTRVKDVIKQFIIPGIVTASIILLYFIIRFRKLGLKVALEKAILVPILAELVLFSVIAIARIPFGRIAIACGIGLYVIIIALLTNELENKRGKKIAEEQEAERK